MHYSGLLVVVRPEDIEEAVRSIESIPGAEVRHHEPAIGRLVVVKEGRTLEDQKNTLLRIQSLPRVILAELVFHYREDGPIADESCAVTERGARKVEP